MSLRRGFRRVCLEMDEGEKMLFLRPSSTFAILCGVDWPGKFAVLGAENLVAKSKARRKAIWGIS
jgi:hypothetical protein